MDPEPESVAPETVAAFQRWARCFCVCVFDLEQGQRLELEFPADSLADEDRQLLRYLAFPDFGPSRSAVESAVFPLRFRRGSGASRGVSRTGRSPCGPGPKREDGFYYAASSFQQQPDEASKRKCSQRSLVVVSQHSFLSLWATLVMRLGQLQHLPFRELLQKAVQAMAEWPNPPSPSSTKMMTLPLLGGILDFCRPGATQFATANGNLLTASSPADEPGWSCTTAWSTGSRSKQQQQQQRARAGAAAAWASLAAEELDFVADQLGLTTIPPGPSGQCQPYSAFAPLSSCLWPLWEVALCGEPLVIFSPDYPTRVAGAVLAVTSLISPVEYMGDYRPYFTIYDGDFEYYRNCVQSNAISSQAAIFGVTNPMIMQLWARFPTGLLLRPLHGGTLPLPEAHHQVLLESPQGERLQRLRREPLPKVKGAKPWGSIIDDQHDERLIMQSDEQFLALLETPCDEDKDQMVRRYFYELTLAFLRPFLPHLKLLKGPEAFNEESFLASLQPVGPFSQLPRADCQLLYDRFINGINFQPWLTKELAKQHLNDKDSAGAVSPSDESASCSGVADEKTVCKDWFSQHQGFAW